MAAPGQPARGLTAAELTAACAELRELVGATVLDIAPLRATAGADDLLVVLQAPPPARGKAFLHLAPGGPRARVTLTARRFAVEQFASGPARDLLRKELVGATLQHVAASPGERRCAFTFRTVNGERRLVVELFGARGLWALLDAEGRCAVLSRAVATAVRTLRLHDVYAPPPAGSDAPVAPVRFERPVLAAIDAHFTALDERDATAAELEALVRAAKRALAKATAKVAGLSQQLADAGRAQALRARADLMLAYAHTVPRGAVSMRVPDPARDGDEIAIELDPSQPVIAQSQALYEKARRLDDGRAIAGQRLAQATTDEAALRAVAEELAPLGADTQQLAASLAPVRAELQRLGMLPKTPSADRATRAKPQPRDDTSGENLRRFVSAEGYAIWVGRTNEQNDRLTMSIANGNDVWLHVGGGRAGAHVIVRLPKQKTASLETLLDAATLAVHFSKARDERRIDVVYTLKKHVRKPKGLPAGAVVPSHTKTLTVLRDEARLARLLASANPEAG
jgi:predicted ribosome quality control (RQC) complex YloA/Tae2 family protein